MSQPLLEALPQLEQTIAAAPHLLLSLNFGGTLAPLLPQPEAVSLSPQVRALLHELAGRRRVSVAIVSGRTRTDLQERVGIPNLYYVGNHGLEISGPGVLFVEPTAAACSGALKQLTSDLEHLVQPIPGALVENKGLTVSVHYRQVAPEQQEKVRQVVHATLAKEDHPFVLKTGQMVFEIRPRIYWNKGSAVTWIQQHLPQPSSLVVYLGDDATDEDAFAALTDGITVRVGAVPETAAHYHVESPTEVQTFLKWLLEQLR